MHKTEYIANSFFSCMFWIQCFSVKVMNKFFGWTIKIGMGSTIRAYPHSQMDEEKTMANTE